MSDTPNRDGPVEDKPFEPHPDGDEAHELEPQGFFDNVPDDDDEDGGG